MKPSDQTATPPTSIDRRSLTHSTTNNLPLIISHPYICIPCSSVLYTYLVCTHTHTHTHYCMYIHTLHVHVYTCIYMFMHTLHVHVHVHVHVYTCIYMFMHTLHVHVHVHVHVYAHTTCTRTTMICASLHGTVWHIVLMRCAICNRHSSTVCES